MLLCLRDGKAEVKIANDIVSADRSVQSKVCPSDKQLIADVFLTDQAHHVCNRCPCMIELIARDLPVDGAEKVVDSESIHFYRALYLLM